MTTTITLIDDVYSSNDSTGRKTLFATLSLLRPISTGGDTVSLSTYFPSKFLGGDVVSINPSVSIAGAGLCAMGVFRGDNSSTASVVFQILNVGVGASFGGLIDNTINVQAATCDVRLIGY